MGEKGFGGEEGDSISRLQNAYHTIYRMGEKSKGELKVKRWT